MRVARRSRHLALAALVALVSGAAACSDDPAGMLPDSGIATDGASVADTGPIEPPDAGGVAQGRVVLSTDTIDFGAVVLTSTGSASVTITNPGAEPVRVTVSEPAGRDADFFSRSLNLPVEMGSFVLEAGGVVTMTVTVTPSELGPLVGFIALDSCGGSCPSGILLLAEGVETALECPDEFDFGVANVDTCIERVVSCNNAGTAIERITVAELEPTSDAAFALTPPALPIELGAAESADFTIRFCPTSPGESAGDLLIATFRPFETERTIHLVARGGGADVSCTPQSLDFGAVGLGATATLDVTCTNEGTDDALLTATLSTTDFAITGPATLQIAPGSSATLTIAVSPSVPGVVSGSLTISTNDPDAPMIDVPLNAEGIMLDPCTASVTPQSRDFGLLAIGESRVISFRVTNDGSTVCLLRQASMAAGSNAAFSVIGAPPAATALDPGESVSISVELVPSLNAIVTGTLVVSFANPVTADLTVDLTGQGGLASLAISPRDLDFGPVPIGCAAPATRKISLRRFLAGTGVVTSAAVSPAGGPFAVADNGALPATLDINGAVELEITFAPGTTGTHTAELQVLAGGLPAPVIVLLSGEGVTSTAVTETFAYVPPRTDLLFVLDDSGGPQPEYDALGAALASFAATVEARAADFHFGVITTDMIDPAKSGRLQGTPAYLDSAATNLAAELAARITGVTDGSNDARAFDAVEAAISDPLATGANAGFLRANTRLAVVFVSDGDDESEASVSIGARLASLRSRVSSLSITGIVGPSGGCSGPHGTAADGSRYMQMILRAGGTVHSLCDPIEDTVQRISDHLLGSTAFPLQGQPRVSTLDVRVDGAQLASTAWRFENAARRVVIDPASVPNGATVTIAYQSICVSPTCGNNAVDANEDCDDGNMNNDDACTTSCLDARCGDGITRAIVEDCDDGNFADDDACLNSCAAAACGDGVLQLGVEECDDGNMIGGDGCPVSCRFYTSSGPVAEPYVELASPISLPMIGTDPNDDGTAELTLPFAFTFFDQPATTLTVAVNGLAGFGGIAEADSFENTTFPDAATPNAIAAVWWDDLFLDTMVSGGASIGYAVEGVAPNRTLTVQWKNVRRVDHSTANHRRFDFQLILFEANSALKMRWGQTRTTGSPPTATSASMGIENAAGDRGIDPFGCSPACSGQQRPMNPNGFPEETSVTFTP